MSFDACLPSDSPSLNTSDRMDTVKEEDELSDLATVLPRVLIVSRRTVRKNKFVDFVGEYHLDLILRYGACPIIVPRVDGMSSLLDSLEPIHGVLLCEGEDIDPSLYASSSEFCTDLSPEEVEEMKALHSSDVALDPSKDSIELQLARRCLERNIPYLGICRGSQILNVACGGTLYQDVEMELTRKQPGDVANLKHIDYHDYDGHRHPIKVLPNTPLAEWFKGSLQSSGEMELRVNSYHHQGVRRLAPRLRPMAYAPDGLIEAYYDPDCCDPDRGRFLVGLQFHPERMRVYQDGEKENAADGEEPLSQFEYPECPKVYQEFIKAVVVYQHYEQQQQLQQQQHHGQEASTAPQPKQQKPQEEKQNLALPPTVPKGPVSQADVQLARRLRLLQDSFNSARSVYEERVQVQRWKRNASERGGSAALSALRNTKFSSSMGRENGHDVPGKQLDMGASFLQDSTPLKASEVQRLKEVGATFRNAGLFKEQMQMKAEQRKAALAALEKLSSVELEEMVAFHKRMAQAAEEVLQSRRKPGSVGVEEDRKLEIASERVEMGVKEPAVGEQASVGLSARAEERCVRGGAKFFGR